jgi:hypothetical protein
LTTPTDDPMFAPLDDPAPAPPDAAVPAEPGLRRVGLWGATASGKSTFLSALFIAATRSPTDLLVKGRNDESTDFLIRNTHSLNAQHQFPPPTTYQTPLSWSLQMSVPNPVRSRLFRPAPATVPFDFRVDLQDAPGRAYAAVPEAQPMRLDLGADDDVPEVASYLADCQGLLLLVDPIRERELGDAHEFFHGTLLRMAQRVEVPAGERLPHYVAVCVTKFDDPSVFRFARDNDFLSYSEDDPLMFPRVHGDEAEQFMRDLFAGSPLSDVDLVVGALRQYFYPERIRYFVTSSVGFYVGSSREFQEDDYWNVVQVEDRVQIRGQVYPINVAEPLLWLGERIAAIG